MVRPFLQRGGMPRGNMGPFRIRGGGVAKPLFPMGPPFRHFGRVLRGPLGFRRPVGPHERLPPPLLHPLEGEEFPIIRRGLFRCGHGGPPPPLMPPYHDEFDPNDEDEETPFHEYSEPPVPLLVHARLSRPPRGIPPRGIPPRGIPPRGIPPRGIPPRGIPPRGIPPRGIPPRGIPPRGRGMPMPLMPAGGHMPPPLGPPMGPMPMRGRGFPMEHPRGFPMEHPRGLRPMLPRGRGIPFFGRGPPPHMVRGGMPPMMRGSFIPLQGRGDKFGGRGNFRGAQNMRRGLLTSNGIHPNDLLALERAKMKELAHPWVTDAMRNEIRKKHRLYQKFKRTHNPSDHTEFKEQRNKVNTMLREAKLEYIGAHPDEDVTKILLEASLVRTARRQSKQQDKESSEDAETGQSAEGTTSSAVADVSYDEDALDYDEEEDDDNDLKLVSEHLRDVEVTVEGEVEEPEALEPRAPEVIEGDYLDGVEEPEEEKNMATSI